MDNPKEELKSTRKRNQFKDYVDSDSNPESDDECIAQVPNDSFIACSYPQEQEYEDNINSAFNKTHGNGWFSYRYALLIGIGHCLSISHVIPFLTLIPHLLCSQNNGITWSRCGKEEICTFHDNNPSSDMIYKLSNGHLLDNWISDFNLMCSSRITLGFFGSLHFAGNVIGAMFILRLGDIYGRKPVLLICTFATMIAVFFLYFSENLYLVYTLMVVTGMLIISKGTMSYIYCLELVPLDQCGSFHAIVCLMGSTFSSLCVVIFYFLTDLRIYFLIISALCVVYFIIVLMVPESPHFLYAQKRWDSLRKVFNQISIVNNANQENLRFKAEIENNNGVPEQTIPILEALRNRIYLKNLLIMVINWSVCSVSFHLLTFSVGHLKGSIYINSLVLGVADILANGISYIYVKSVGFNYGFTASYLVVLIISLVYSFVHLNQGMSYVFLFFIKFFITLCTSLCYFGTSQLFEAKIKSRSFAICKFCSRLLTVFSPIIAEIIVYPILFISILICGASICSQLLENPKTSEENSLKDS